MQCSTSVGLPSQGRPQALGYGLLHRRRRSLCPLPQVAEHVDHRSHDDHIPSAERQRKFCIHFDIKVI